MKLFRKVCHDGPTLIYSFAMTDVWSLVCQTPGQYHAQEPTLIHMNSWSRWASPRWVKQWLSAMQAEVTHVSGADVTKKIAVSGKKLQKTSFFLCLVMSCPTEADHQTFTTGMTMGHKSPPKKVASGNVFLYFLVFPFIPLLVHRSEISKLC